MINDQQKNRYAWGARHEPLFGSVWTASIASDVATSVQNIAAALRKYWLLGCFVAAAISAIGAAAPGQPAPASPSVSEQNTAPAPIPLEEVATNAEAASAQVRDIQADLSSDRTTEEVADQLPALTREIDTRLRESRNIIAQRPSVEMLVNMEEGWRRLRRELSDMTRDLTSRVSRLQQGITQLDDLSKTWQLTFDAGKNSSAPPEVLRRIEAVVTQIKQADDAVEKQRARALTMQNRVAAQDARIADTLTLISQARENTLNRLFVKDSPAIWSTEVRSRTVQDLQQESRSSFSTQWEALLVYAERQTGQFFLHAAVFIAFAGGLFWAHRNVRAWSAEEAGLSRSAAIFQMPIAAALMLSFLCSRWIYPQAPRLLWAMLGALSLIPSVIILRRLIMLSLYPILYTLIVFYIVDQIRTVAAALQSLPRLLFLTEMLAAMLFLVWLLRSMARSPFSNTQERPRKTIKVAAWVALAISSVAFIANILGYVTLANLLGNALLGGAYLALILYALIEVLDGVVLIAMDMRPLALLGIVRHYRALLRHRVRRGLQWLAAFLWLLFMLQRLLLRERLFKAIQDGLTAEFTVGSLSISSGDVLAFVITVWAAFLVSRFVRFLLDEDVYPRIHLNRGLPYAISNTLHYLILLVGFFAAVAALGFDMTKVTILAGAFSIGVGFGLQNVFNNFISGLILLFERPINIGDVIQIGDASGVVERIGIRASVIRTPNGSEVIVPNGQLISERLINWTLSNRQYSIVVPIGVARDADPSRVIALLERSAAAHPLVARDPPPQALVVKLGPDSLAFELRAWTDHSEQWMQVRSELAIAINSALAAEKIAIQ